MPCILAHIHAIFQDYLKLMSLIINLCKYYRVGHYN